jgi:hypothetical protein
VPLTSEESVALFAALEDRGWRWKDDFIYAPHETMWLMRRYPWSGDLQDFIARMRGRLGRVSTASLQGFEEVLHDTQLLVDALVSVRR